MPHLPRCRLDRFGRSYHLRIRSAEDLRAALRLDDAHWVASAAPIESLRLEPAFLTALDTQANGRILCSEVRSAISWTLDMLADTSGLSAGSDRLELSAIRTGTPAGDELADTCRRILHRVGDASASAVTLEQVRTVKARVQANPVSESGVVLPDAAKTPEAERLLQDILATVGGQPHPSGQVGVGPGQLERFLSEADAWLAWHSQGQANSAEARALVPLGERTAEAAAAMQAIESKLEQFYAQCRALRVQPELASRLQAPPAPDRLDLANPEAIEEMLAAAPLAAPNPREELPLNDGANPHYAVALDRFHRAAAAPILGEVGEFLSARQWRQIRDMLRPYVQWQASRPAVSVDVLGADRLREVLGGPGPSQLRELIAASAETSLVLTHVGTVEKLLLCQAHLMELANNFVSFPRLYDPGDRAAFEMGTLIADGRRLSFAVQVTDRARHARVSEGSNMCVLYAEVRPVGGPAYAVAVAVTHGGVGNLCVGCRGVFVDVNGATHDAEILQIVENPISVVEAFVSPFRRIGRMLTARIESITSEAEKKLDAQTGEAVSSVRERERGGVGTGGVLAGGGLAIAALGSAVAFITSTLADTAWWKILVGLAAAVLAVVLPASVLAVLKLRRRDLSAVLAGAGWAINARMRLTWRQARMFTRRPAYPKGSRGGPRHRWLRWLIVLAILAGLVWGGIYLYGALAAGSPWPAEPAPSTLPSQPVPITAESAV